MSDPAWVMDGWAASRIGGSHRDLLASFQERVVVEVKAESLLKPPDPAWVADLFERQAGDQS
jgi:predicted RNA binding protein YcfA (HicA-like mRNA interferase family)